MKCVDAASVNSEVLFCDWPPPVSRVVAFPTTIPKAPRRRKKRATLAPASKAMHEAYGADRYGSQCGDCRSLVIHATRRHPRSAGSLINIYRCRIHERDNPHVWNQTWALGWPACGKFAERSVKEA